MSSSKIYLWEHVFIEQRDTSPSHDHLPKHIMAYAPTSLEARRVIKIGERAWWLNQICYVSDGPASLMAFEVSNLRELDFQYVEIFPTVQGGVHVFDAEDMTWQIDDLSYLESGAIDCSIRAIAFEKQSPPVFKLRSKTWQVFCKDYRRGIVCTTKIEARVYWTPVNIKTRTELSKAKQVGQFTKPSSVSSLTVKLTADEDGDDYLRRYHKRNSDNQPSCGASMSYQEITATAQVIGKIVEERSNSTLSAPKITPGTEKYFLISGPSTRSKISRNEAVSDVVAGIEEANCTVSYQQSQGQNIPSPDGITALSSDKDASYSSPSGTSHGSKNVTQCSFGSSSAGQVGETIQDRSIEQQISGSTNPPLVTVTSIQCKDGLVIKSSDQTANDRAQNADIDQQKRDNLGSPPDYSLQRDFRWENARAPALSNSYSSLWHHWHYMKHTESSKSKIRRKYKE